jgi:hypothetical protein
MPSMHAIDGAGIPPQQFNIHASGFRNGRDSEVLRHFAAHFIIFREWLPSGNYPKRR